ncbi:unnamed protein product [Phaeothamnion confervicola]
MAAGRVGSAGSRRTPTERSPRGLSRKIASEMTSSWTPTASMRCPWWPKTRQPPRRQRSAAAKRVAAAPLAIDQRRRLRRIIIQRRLHWHQGSALQRLRARALPDLNVGLGMVLASCPRLCDSTVRIDVVHGQEGVPGSNDALRPAEHERQTVLAKLDGIGSHWWKERQGCAAGAKTFHFRPRAALEAGRTAAGGTNDGKGCLRPRLFLEAFVIHLVRTGAVVAGVWLA